MKEDPFELRQARKIIQKEMKKWITAYFTDSWKKLGIKPKPLFRLKKKAKKMRFPAKLRGKNFSQTNLGAKVHEGFYGQIHPSDISK